ncbi:hypothetical protein NVIE_0697 [Nitrososphaera viennensis EN76]|uniref:Uncharacterized protein n=1 Tax=Nitrososphaera viennensis EN76 TaxID=926571 RepID=A0A060HDZ6_9ARCH|nr:hypothetical protein NVIE_0697 [Nitrososphaera viennensis EN76]
MSNSGVPATKNDVLATAADKTTANTIAIVGSFFLEKLFIKSRFCAAFI